VVKNRRRELYQFQKREKIHLSSAFCSSLSLNGLESLPPHEVRVNILSQFTDSQNIFIDISRINGLPAGYPITQPNWCLILIIALIKIKIFQVKWEI
jgi:hypothetical protein